MSAKGSPPLRIIKKYSAPVPKTTANRMIVMTLFKGMSPCASHSLLIVIWLVCEPGQSNAYQSGIANCGPSFLTFPTILSTGQIFNASPGQDACRCWGRASGNRSQPHQHRAAQIQLEGVCLQGAPRQQCAENQIGDNGFQQGAGRPLIASRDGDVVGDHDAAGQRQPKPEPEHPCSLLGQYSRSGQPSAV